MRATAGSGPSGSSVRRAAAVTAVGLLALLAGCTSQVAGQASPATAATPSESPGPQTSSSAPEPEPTPSSGSPSRPAPGAEPVWSAADLTEVLAAYADDETEDWAAFSSDATVQVPCGGEGAHGLSPEVLETTAGGNIQSGSAQIFADARAAARELDRLDGLLRGCDGPFDYISASTGDVLTTCGEPVVTSYAPVLQYDEQCDIGAPEGTDWAVFRTGNAVVAVSAPGGQGLFAALPELLTALGADG